MYPTSTFKCGPTNERAREADERRWSKAIYDLPIASFKRPAMLEASRPTGHVVAGRAFWGGGFPDGALQKRALVHFRDGSELIYQVRKEGGRNMLRIFTQRAGKPITGLYEIELIEGGRDPEDGTYRGTRLKLICEDTGKSGRKLYLLPGASRFVFPSELPTNLKRDAEEGKRNAMWFGENDPPPRLDDELFEGLLTNSASDQFACSGEYYSLSGPPPCNAGAGPYSASISRFPMAFANLSLSSLPPAPK